MNERERQVRYVLHHCIAHPMLVVFPRLGAWLHDMTDPCPPRPAETTTFAPDHIPTSYAPAGEIRRGARVWMWDDFHVVANVWALGSEVRLTFDDGMQVCLGDDVLVEILAVGHPAGGAR